MSAQPNTTASTSVDPRSDLERYYKYPITWLSTGQRYLTSLNKTQLSHFVQKAKRVKEKGLRIQDEDERAATKWYLGDAKAPRFRDAFLESLKNRKGATVSLDNPTAYQEYMALTTEYEGGSLPKNINPTTLDIWCKHALRWDMLSKHLDPTSILDHERGFIQNGLDYLKKRKVHPEIRKKADAKLFEALETYVVEAKWRCNELMAKPQSRTMTDILQNTGASSYLPSSHSANAGGGGGSLGAEPGYVEGQSSEMTGMVQNYSGQVSNSTWDQVTAGGEVSSGADLDYMNQVDQTSEMTDPIGYLPAQASFPQWEYGSFALSREGGPDAPAGETSRVEEDEM